MNNIICPNCKFVNEADTKFCQRCKESWLASLNGPPASTIRLYIPTFQTDLFGIMLLDQKQHQDEVFSATRWVFLFIPLFPLTHITFRINKIETLAAQLTLFRIKVLASRRPCIFEVLSVYLRVVIGVLPAILAVKFGDSIKNILGFWGNAVTIIGGVIWFILVLIKMQNDKIDYKKYES